MSVFRVMCIAGVLMAALMPFGCGMKGDLYLPNERGAAEPSAAPSEGRGDGKTYR